MKKTLTTTAMGITLALLMACTMLACKGRSRMYKGYYRATPDVKDVQSLDSLYKVGDKVEVERGAVTLTFVITEKDENY